MKHYECPHCNRHTIVLDLEHNKYRCRSRDCLFIIHDTEDFLKKVRLKEKELIDTQAAQAPV